MSETGGLTSDEARARLSAHGPNRLVGRDRAARIREAVALLLDPMTLMLAATAALYAVLGQVRDATIMLVALVPVIGVDVFLEARSRSALKKLAERVAPRARVVRDGRELSIAAEGVVPGDWLVLAEGQFIHADGVVRSAANLAIDESSLTGEAEPQIKRPLPGGGAEATAEVAPDARFFAGSMVMAGHGLGEVSATGGQTRFGDIARQVAAADVTTTPLQRRVGRLVRRLAIVAGIVAVAVVGLARLRGLSWADALLGGISLAMSAAPEEFPLVFTLFLSVGAWRLTRRGVLVRRLASVETLGSTTVICSDKTGTLTKGEFVLDTLVPLTGDDGGAGAVVDAGAAADSRGLLEAAILACEHPAADPMERAILDRAAALGADVAGLLARWELIRDHDFDPVGKHMSHVWARTPGAPPTRPQDEGEMWVVAKGALEGILEHTVLTLPQRRAAEAAHARLAADGARVLAVAARRGPKTPAPTRADDERSLTLLGLLAFRDPIRPEVPAAVRECQAAGVRIKIVTGDHALTAHAIAERAGIAHRDDTMVTGAELERATDPAVRRRLVVEAAILSRISPAQKHLIVDTLRAAGEIVAMTGDGINDAPALRRADIGVSMGVRGTDVARAAADLVLLEDDFTAIVAGVREGRKIFLDIQRAFLYLIAFHIPIVLLALLPPVAGLPLLLLPVHLVWLELIVHPVSALVFQGDPAPPDLMQRPPRDPRAPMLPRAAMLRSVASGSLLTIAVFALYAWQVRRGSTEARSLALATLLLGYQLLVIVERAPEPRTGGGMSGLLTRSRRFWLIWGASALSLPLLMYLPPAARIMGLAPLAGGWGLALGGAVLALGWRFLPAFPAWAWRRKAPPEAQNAAMLNMNRKPPSGA